MLLGRGDRHHGDRLFGIQAGEIERREIAPESEGHVSIRDQLFLGT
jgi:hypothetical protein